MEQPPDVLADADEMVRGAECDLVQLVRAAHRREGVAGARGTPSPHHQTRRRDREADAKLADDTFRAAKAHNAELLRLEQEHDTQTALTTMRRAGMIAGVNPPKPDPREPPNETDV